MKATIITIGDEILIGQIVDTNSVSIAKHLNAAGIVVREKLSIGDDRTQIIESVERALTGSNVVILTGGLGPTKDDITKKTLAEMFHSELVPDARVAEHVCRSIGIPVDGVLTGCILAVGRILGETAALLYTAGFAHTLYNSLRATLEGSGATLSVALYVYAKEQGEFDVAFAIAAILMALALLINLAAMLTGRYFKKRRSL